MASEVDICRRALGRLGELTVPSDVLTVTTGPENTTPEANVIRLYWASTLDEVLRSHPWNHAKKYLPLVAASAVAGPAENWPWVQTLPADFVRMLQVGDGLDFEITEGRKLLLTEAGKGAVIQYVTRVVWPCEDELFNTALELKLAARIAPRLRGGSSAEIQPLVAEYERIVAPLAHRIDANESGRRGMRPYRSALAGFLNMQRQ